MPVQLVEDVAEPRMIARTGLAPVGAALGEHQCLGAALLGEQQACRGIECILGEGIVGGDAGERGERSGGASASLEEHCAEQIGLAARRGGVARDLDQAQRERAIVAARQPERDPGEQFGEPRGGAVDRDSALGAIEVEQLERRIVTDQQRLGAVALPRLGERGGEREPQPDLASPADIKRLVDQRQRVGDALAVQQHRRALFGDERREQAVGGDIRKPRAAVVPRLLLGPATQDRGHEAAVAIAGALVDHPERVIGAAAGEQIGDDQHAPVEPQQRGCHAPRDA